MYFVSYSIILYEYDMIRYEYYEYRNRVPIFFVYFYPSGLVVLRVSAGL